MIFTGKSNGQLGLIVINEDTTILMRGGNAGAGDVLQFDLAQTNVHVTNNVPGHESSGYVNVIAPTAGGVAGGSILCVALAAINEDEPGLVRLSGIVTAFTLDSSGNIVPGDKLVAAVTKDLDNDTPAIGERFIAICQVTVTGPSTRTLGTVLFDGIRGFGTYSA